MLCNNKVSVASGKVLDYGPIIARVISFVNTIIVCHNFKYWSQVCAKDNENRLNDKFVAYLNHFSIKYLQYNEFKFAFCNQPVQDEKSSTNTGTPDIGVALSSDYGISQYFLYMEGKRLPGRGGEFRREYVQGKGGGIERFKTNFHARKLDQSIIIAYVQKKAKEDWPTTINKWIDDLISHKVLPTKPQIEPSNIDYWNENDKLVKVSDIQYSSNNSRNEGKENIQLQHFFIDLT